MIYNVWQTAVNCHTKNLHNKEIFIKRASKKPLIIPLPLDALSSTFAFNDVERMQAEAHQTANIISLATFLDKKI